MKNCLSFILELKEIQSTNYKDLFETMNFSVDRDAISAEEPNIIHLSSPKKSRANKVCTPNLILSCDGNMASSWTSLSKRSSSSLMKELASHGQKSPKKPDPKRQALISDYFSPRSKSKLTENTNSKFVLLFSFFCFIEKIYYEIILTKNRQG